MSRPPPPWLFTYTSCSWTLVFNISASNFPSDQFLWKAGKNQNQSTWSPFDPRLNWFDVCRQMTFSKRLQRCKENWPHLVIQPFLPSSTNLLSCSLNWNWRKKKWWTTACNYSVMLEKKLTESQKLWGADCKNFYNFVAAQSFTLFGHFDFQDSWSHLDQLFNLEWAVPHGEREDLPAQSGHLLRPFGPDLVWIFGLVTQQPVWTVVELSTTRGLSWRRRR